MADSKADLLAGAGGLVTEESQTNHEGRRALLLVRNNEDCTEFIALAKTMGISIVERVEQRGRDDPKWFMGQGKLQDIAEELASRTAKHPWENVDLLLLHTNATPRQLVGVNDTVGLEVWDRVRLLLSLFTAHASSVEARTQVRIARLQSDRTVLREVVKQQTTGERAGFGGAGKTAAGSVLTNVNAELAALRKKQRKHNRSESERRRQRKKQAVTVGLAGYTNAGKSSLFRNLYGKEVLVEDCLFSTLESTIGRLEASPRVLLADTIGFIDGLPNATLDAFRATLAEAIECDLLLLLVDVGDPITEIDRKLQTSLRELSERVLESDHASIMERIQLVLTKADTTIQSSIDSAIEMVATHGFINPIVISSHAGTGIEELRTAMLHSLFGPQRTVVLHPGEHGEPAIEALLSRLFDTVFVHDHQRDRDMIEVQISASDETLAILQATYGERIELK